VKAQHLRRPRFSKLDRCLMVVAACLFLLGMWRLAADAHPDGRVSSPPTTTTTMINSSVIVPETKTTSTTVFRSTTSITQPKKSQLKVAIRPVQSSTTQRVTTMTTEAPKTPLEIAQSQVGKTGPYAEGGYWCDSFIDWVAQQAKIEDFISRDTPSALYADAKTDGRLTDQPVIGDMIFIDLFGPELGHGQVSHVGIVEYIDGQTIGIIQGNGEPDPSVVTRTTYTLGDGHVLGFAPFTGSES
jgi:hypothetical protein